ncbi:MAG TPA: ATP-binding protein [Gemmatimonadaceae bacterium]|nr:ATP-binding protein [Gemmatimonadaceae bacterium]
MESVGSAEPVVDRSGEAAVLAPSGRDGPLAAQVLGRWAVPAVAYADMAALCAAVRRGVGVVVLAEEALHADARDVLLRELDAQPAWSDVPLVVLTPEGELARAISSGVEALARRGNVTLLERPVRVATLVTAVRSALRARERQYDVRDALTEVEAARVEAERANRAKSDFLAVMSHELRTPLNAIAGYVELIELEVHGPVTGAQREALRRVQKSQRHLLGLINGVLNYARIETGTVRFELAPVPVDETLATCEALIAPQASARGLRLDFPGCDPALAIHGDMEKVRQIVLNLLTNAVKFTEPGGTVSMTGEARDGTVLVRVADTGCGIADDKQQAIFEPFVQVDVRLTRTQEGVGLGLAISRDLARGMGGELTVESTVGAGSTFTLSLPRA